MHGDLVEDGLGLSDKDRSMLTRELDIIINSAASVNFDDPLKQAL
jgi:thioester reductase-like protein